MAVLLTLIGSTPALWPQASPSATGPRRFGIQGTLKYSLRYSEMTDFQNSGQGGQQLATFSGDLNYQNGSERHPFVASFGGGYLWQLAGADYGNGFFENLNVNQTFVGKHWNVMLGDQTAYHKQTPATGASGQSGTGEPIGAPNPNPPDQTVIALNTVMINNSLFASYSHRITPGTTFSSTGTYSILRYPSGGEIETNRYQDNSGIAWRLNARSSIETDYQYSRYRYIGYDLVVSSNAVLAGYDHRWSRHFSSTISAGPQWVSSSNTLLEPGELTYQASGVTTYILPRGSAGLAYTHGFYGGSGFVLGSTIDTANLNFQHAFRNRFVIESTLGYQRTEKLDGTGLISSKVAGAQLTKQLGRKFSVFANYTAAVQSQSAGISSGALNGVWQRFSVGAGLTPPAIHLGR